MRMTTIFFVLGPVLESLAGNIGVIILGRFLSGVDAGDDQPRDSDCATSGILPEQG